MSKGVEGMSENLLVLWIIDHKDYTQIAKSIQDITFYGSFGFHL